jgi:CBS domain-containing protein
MQCMDVMSRDLFSIGPDDTVMSAACRMRDANVEFLLVCNAAGTVVGTLTERDVAVRLAAEDRIASRSSVDDIMTPEVVSCLATDDLARAHELMAQERTPRVLVTNDEGRLQGVVRLRDVVPRQ